MSRYLGADDKRIKVRDDILEAMVAQKRDTKSFSIRLSWSQFADDTNATFLRWISIMMAC